MKFVCTNSDYRTFRGHVFAHGLPTTVIDRATIEALKKKTEFKEVVAPTEETVTTRIDPYACPKCGRIVKQGRVLHIKHCKGKQ